MATLHSVVKQGNPKEVSKFIKKNNNVNAKDRRGQTALHVGCEHGLTTIVKVLVDKHKADVNAQDRNGWTPLHVAASAKHLELCELLLRNGANVSTTSQDNASALHYFVRGVFGSEPKYSAILKEIIEKGADINAKNKNGDTPLHIAASYGVEPAVKVLLEKKADVRLVNNNRETCLHLAARGGYTKVFAMLLEAGADPGAEGANGSVRKVAESAHQTEILKQLLELPPELLKADSVSLIVADDDAGREAVQSAAAPSPTPSAGCATASFAAAPSASTSSELTLTISWQGSKFPLTVAANSTLQHVLDKIPTHLVPRERKRQLEFRLTNGRTLPFRVAGVKKLVVTDGSNVVDATMDALLVNPKTLLGHFYNEYLKGVRPELAKRLFISLDHDTLKFGKEFSVKFKRTLRVAGGAAKVPATLGNYELYKVTDYAGRVPASWAKQGGVFFPMYQSEACFLQFASTSPHAVKVGLADRNAVTGAEWDKRLVDAPMQNYIACPPQHWLFGVAVPPSPPAGTSDEPRWTVGLGPPPPSDRDGLLLQLQVMPKLFDDVEFYREIPLPRDLRSPAGRPESLPLYKSPRMLGLGPGDVLYMFSEKISSREATLDDYELRDGDELVLDSRSEADHPPAAQAAAEKLTLTVRNLPQSRLHTFTLPYDTRIKKVKALMQRATAIPSYQQKLQLVSDSDGSELADDVQLADCQPVPNAATGEWQLELLMDKKSCEGSEYRESYDHLQEFAGGAETVADVASWRQNIIRDPHGGIFAWDRKRAIRVYVHLISSALFKEVVGMPVPRLPITPMRYAVDGLPWQPHYAEDPNDPSAATSPQADEDPSRRGSPKEKKSSLYTFVF